MLSQRETNGALFPKETELRLQIIHWSVTCPQAQTISYLSSETVMKLLLLLYNYGVKKELKRREITFYLLFLFYLLTFLYQNRFNVCLKLYTFHMVRCGFTLMSCVHTKPYLKYLKLFTYTHPKRTVQRNH